MGMAMAIYWSRGSTQALTKPGKKTWKVRIQKVIIPRIREGRQQLHKTRG